jgi:hypothetical protein
VACPTYDRTPIVSGIVHLGLGNFHRAHQAIYIERYSGAELDHYPTHLDLYSCPAERLAIRVSDDHLPRGLASNSARSLRDGRNGRSIQTPAIFPHNVATIGADHSLQLRAANHRGAQGIHTRFYHSGGSGGPIDSTLFYTLYLYQQGFAFFKMGYASAMAWVLLIAIAAITAATFALSKQWVHYEYEQR